MGIFCPGKKDLLLQKQILQSHCSCSPPKNTTLKTSHKHEATHNSKGIGYLPFLHPSPKYPTWQKQLLLGAVVALTSTHRPWRPQSLSSKQSSRYWQRSPSIQGQKSQWRLYWKVLYIKDRKIERKIRGKFWLRPFTERHGILSENACRTRILMFAS